MRKPLLKLVEGTKGCPGVSRREAGGQHGRQPLCWAQNFPFLGNAWRHQSNNDPNEYKEHKEDKESL